MKCHPAISMRKLGNTLAIKLIVPASRKPGRPARRPASVVHCFPYALLLPRFWPPPRDHSRNVAQALRQVVPRDSPSRIEQKRRERLSTVDRLAAGVRKRRRLTGNNALENSHASSPISGVAMTAPPHAGMSVENRLTSSRIKFENLYIFYSAVDSSVNSSSAPIFRRRSGDLLPSDWLSRHS